MEMYNIKVLIKSDETLQDIIAEVCDEGNVGPDEHFVFSAIITPDEANNCRALKLNCSLQSDNNLFTVRDTVIKLFTKKNLPPSNIVYIQPPIECWLSTFRPLLFTMVNRVEMQYKKLIPDRDDLLSILYMTVLSLYNKGYYLHKTLIFKSYLKSLNKECRKIKNFQNIESLDAITGYDNDDKPIALIDSLVDPDSVVDDTKEYWQDMFKQLKELMLESMSQLQFDRIMIQLATNTVDRSTSYKLNKFREMLNPEYKPRPNSKGKSKGGNKK